MISTLWPHQVAAADAVDAELARGVRSTLVVHATGTGKTTTGTEIVLRRRPQGRALWLAHREELVRQGAARMRAHGLTVGIEMADEHAGEVERLDVVAGTVQTLAGDRRRERFAADAFATVIVDEAHHAPARTYRTILDHFPHARVVGITATPDRGDKVAMARAFESVAHVYAIRDAIRDGYLCPVRQRAIHVEGLDLSRVRTTAGDLNEGDLEAVLLDPDLLQAVAGAIVDAAGSRKTMIFGVTVAHAHALAAALNGYEPESARACDGGTETEIRRSTLASFAAGKFRRLVNCALWTEGFDEPSIECVAVVRPTKSRALYTQMVGRGTRIHPGKRDLLILDFQGNAGRHSLACPIDILGGADVDPAVKAKASRAMAERPGLDVLTAIEQATRELAEERRRRMLDLASYRAVDVDPFELVDATLGVVAADDGTSYEANLAYLKRHAPGLQADRIKPTQAAQLAATLRQRAADGRATFAQVRCLQRAGLPYEVDRATASEAIDALAANGWKPTEELRARLAQFAEILGMGEGERCGRGGCDGKILAAASPESCTCFLGNPPCSACTTTILECSDCGWSATDRA